jgi:catechol 2,3-dioxygenase-like lactoylglutathione lyase family enzyme
MSNTSRPAIKGFHHVKLAVSDLGRSLAFYEDFLGAERIPEADHRKEADGKLYGYIVDVPGLGTKLELRLNAEQAEKHRRFDQFTIAVKDRHALSEWGSYLDHRNIKHSPVISAIQAWLIVVEDPDGNRWRLYTLEKHGPEIKPDEDNVWLQD